MQFAPKISLNNAFPKYWWCQIAMSLTIFIIFLQWIMSETLEGHEDSIGIGGMQTANLRFVYYIDELVMNRNSTRLS